jgi:hypothetical protein
MVKLKVLGRRRSTGASKEMVLDKNINNKVDKEKASSNPKRKSRFRRVKDKNLIDTDTSKSGETSCATDADADVLPQSQEPVPPFSTLSDMAILHNSVSTSLSVHGEDSNHFDAQNDSDSVSVLAPGSASPSVFGTRTQNAMRFALQSRMYVHEEATSPLDRWEALGDDPTVEESIECVFEHQLEEGIEIHVEDDEGSLSNPGSPNCDELVDNFGCGYGGHGYDNGYGFEEKKHYTSGKLTHVTSYSPFMKRTKNYLDDASLDSDNRSPSSSPETSSDKKRVSKALFRTRSAPHPSIRKRTVDRPSARSLSKKIEFFSCDVCKDGVRPYLGIPPEQWPQAPLFLRPCPGSGMKILGVRYANSDEYIMDETLKTPWWEHDFSTIEKSDDEDATADTVKESIQHPYCSQCCCLPINNGNEPDGKTIVIDFESSCFQGTLQVRIRHTRGTIPEPYDDSKGYFHGFNRQYQSIIQGRFTRPGIPMTRCEAGQTFKDPLKLPPAYVVKGSMKIVQFFAPRLNAKVNGSKPMFTSPLGSTPQTVMADPWKPEDGHKFRVEGICRSGSSRGKIVEPIEEERKLIPYKCNNPTTSVSRAKARKKAFDKLCAEGDEKTTFRTDRVYTFESLQHLVDFRPLEVNMGNILGKMRLSPVMNGQPMNIMAGYPSGNLSAEKDPHGFEKFWSFEIWHATMIERMLKKNM